MEFMKGRNYAHNTRLLREKMEQKGEKVFYETSAVRPLKSMAYGRVHNSRVNCDRVDINVY